jgi:UDP-N-acetylmuramoyl-tripeptide--D-alanyl-D-alanine ligase
MQRRTLDRTKAARLLLLALRCGISLEVLVGAMLIYLGGWHDFAGGVAFGVALIVAYPVIWAHALVLPLILGKQFINGPATARNVKETEKIFAAHPGVKLAILGSYGKTTMKELLLTVLGEGKNVVATPANKNVSASHAKFAHTLTGAEDIVIIEYGEGAPGDIARFAEHTHPSHAVITGLAPAHLDHYKTLQAAGEDLFSIQHHVPADQLYVDDEAASIKPFVKKDYGIFNTTAALGWQITDVDISLQGTTFTLKHAKATMRLQSALVGRHQVAFLAFAAIFALQQGLSKRQIEAGIAKTKPFEHRMQPYKLNGAWIVDDTYNGNIEGIRAGTQLLKNLNANRKIYVTPGLVDQGEETERVHLELGELIAEANPDLVVLMKNSVTKFIQIGLKSKGYKGELRVEVNPLDFYTNLGHFVATGDLVVMQNDWTDNYA